MTTETAAVRPVNSMALGVRGLWESLTAPATFFAAVKQTPTHLVPWIALLIIFIVSFVPIMPLTEEMMVERMQQEMSNRGAAPADAPDSGMFVKIGLVFGAIGVVGLLPLVLASCALFWGNFVFAGKASFGLILSVALYGLYSHFLVKLIDLPLVLASKNIYSGISLAVFAPEASDQSVVWTALSQFSLANIVQVLVMGIALQQIYAIERNKGILIAVLTIGVLALLQIGSAAVGSMVR